MGCFAVVVTACVFTAMASDGTPLEAQVFFFAGLVLRAHAIHKGVRYGYVGYDSIYFICYLHGRHGWKMKTAKQIWKGIFQDLLPGTSVSKEVENAVTNHIDRLLQELKKCKRNKKPNRKDMKVIYHMTTGMKWRGISIGVQNHLSDCAAISVDRGTVSVIVKFSNGKCYITPFVNGVCGSRSYKEVDAHDGIDVENVLRSLEPKP